MHFPTALIALVSSLPLAAQAMPTTSANPALEAHAELDKRNFGNCNGCSRCNLSGTFIGNCQDAVNRFQDGRNYASQTRFTVGDCFADWYCNGAYPVKDGRDIKNVFKVGIWQKAGCRACGEWWLTDGSNCHGTIQAKGC